MAKWIDVPYLTCLAGEDLQKFRRVKLSVGGSAIVPPTVVYADAGEDAIGVTRAAVDDNDRNTIGVILLTKDGTLPMIASGAITAMALVYGAADGKVTATVTGRALGRALQAATADGDQVEVLPILGDFVGDIAGQFTLEDDFFFFDTTEGPFDVTGDAGSTGTTDVTDAAGGVMAVYTDGDDNDEMYLHTITENFKFAANKPLYFEARAAVTEGSTNAGAFIIGLMDAAGADALQDTEAGPKASYSGVVFYKVAGGLTWSAEASIAGTQTAITLSGAGVTYVSGTFYRFGIEFIPTSSTASTINLYIDGLLVGTTAFTFTSATEMDVILGAKSNGSAEELISVDYVRVSQVR